MNLLHFFQWWIFYKWLFYNDDYFINDPFTTLQRWHLTLTILHNIWMVVMSLRMSRCNASFDLILLLLNSWLCCAWIFFYLHVKISWWSQSQEKTKYPSTYLYMQNMCKCIIMNKYKLKLQCVPKVCLSFLLLTCCNSKQRLPLLI